MKNFALNGFITLISITVAIGLFELTLRLWQPEILKIHVGSNQYKFYKFDETLGWANVPNIRGVFTRAEFSYPVTIGSDGLRRNPLSAPTGSYIAKVAVLGDSFTWGIGASDEELFITILSKEFPNVEFLNFGVSGYGPVQYYLLTEKVMTYNPDLVVIMFCLGNDFADNVFWNRYGYYKPFARLTQDGKVKILGYPLPNVQKFRSSFSNSSLAKFSERFSVIRLIGLTIAPRDTSTVTESKKHNTALVSDDLSGKYSSPEIKEVVEVNRQLLASLIDAYKARDIPVVIVAAPSKCQFENCKDLPLFDSFDPRLALRQSMQGLSATFIDPTEIFTIEDFWQYDGHWRAVGNLKIAETLNPVITEHLSTQSNSAYSKL